MYGPYIIIIIVYHFNDGRNIDYILFFTQTEIQII